jgi:hypothetical protein
MYPIAFAIAIPAAFAAGVVFHKYVISEAEAVKKHVTDEIAKVRDELSNALKSVAGKL